MNALNQLSHENAISTWLEWLSNNPKDFLDTSGLLIGTTVTAIVAGLTYRLFQLNRDTLAANSRQNNQNILGAVFEEGMLSVDQTMNTLSKVVMNINGSAEFFPNHFGLSVQDAEAQKENAEKFGLRLDLYGVKEVSAAYQGWLIAMIDFMNLWGEIQGKAQVTRLGSLNVPDAERIKYAPKLNELMETLKTQKQKIMTEMNKLVAIS